MGVLMKSFFRTTWMVGVLVLFSLNTNAEGTRVIMRTDSSHGKLQVYQTFGPFATYNCEPAYRLNISICNPGEKVCFGFGYTRDADQIIHKDVQFRIKDPAGNIIMGPMTLDTGAGAAGFIENYQQAVAGPNTLDTTGYIPLCFTPSTTGDYYIEFSVTFERREFDYFDITVIDTTANQAIPGRVWSKAWQFTVSGSPPPNQWEYEFDGILYIYTDDGIVTSVDFNGMQPYVFTLSSNITGCDTTGDFLSDRRSRIGGPHTYPQYKIFLNNPDPVCFPSGVYGSFSAPSNISGCPDDYCVNVTVNKPGKVELLIDLNGIDGYQPGTEDIMINPTVDTGLNCIPWDGYDGQGNLVPTGANVMLEIFYSNGLTHMPLHDVEYNKNGYKVRIVRPYTPDSIPALFWDDSTNLSSLGGTIEKSGCINPSGCHSWDCYTSDCSSFPYSIGEGNTVNTWWYAASNVKDTVFFNHNFTTVDANNSFPPDSSNDMEVCSAVDSIPLSGEVNYSTGGVWSTGGSGVFTPNDSDLTAFYDFSTEDIEQGVVSLYLTSTGDPNKCNPVSDSLQLVIHPSPEITLDSVPINCEQETKGEIIARIARGTYPFQYQWSTHSAQTDSIAMEIDTTGKYYLTVIDRYNCTDTDSTLVLYIPCDVEIPNVFTPNRDGLNETLVIREIEYYPENVLYIYNRWGNKIKEFSDYENQWDGTDVADNNVPEGTYFYILKYNGNIVKKGTITIIR